MAILAGAAGSVRVNLELIRAEIRQLQRRLEVLRLDVQWCQEEIQYIARRLSELAEQLGAIETSDESKGEP